MKSWLIINYQLPIKMLKNYLNIALRSLIKNKLFSFINIFGLSIGIAGSLLILVYVFNELSYENIHDKKDSIYKLGLEFGSGNSSMKMAGVMPALSEAILE
jgi:putative ABC transport system permease protein